MLIRILSLIVLALAPGNLCGQGMISSMSPSSVQIGSGAFTLTVNGSGFGALSVVQWNSTNLTTTVVNSTKLTAVVPATLVAAVGTANVRVRLSVFPLTFTSALSFTISPVPNPVPFIGFLSPSTALVNAGPTFLGITGTGFIAASVVRANGSPVETSFQSSTSLAVTLPSAVLNAAALISIDVVNPTPGGGASNQATFVVSNPVPTITIVAPLQVAIGVGATTLHVLGSGFVSSTQILINGVAHPSTVLPTGATIDVPIPSTLTSAPSTLQITAVNPSPGGGTSNSAPVSVQYATPHITSLSPTTLTAGSSSAVITVTGSGFSPATTAAIGTVAATTSVTATQVSGTLLEVTLNAPALAIGTPMQLWLTNPNPGGGTSTPAPFTILNPLPTLTAISPNSGPVGSPATPITFTGSGYTPSSIVRVVGGPLLVTTFVSSSTLTASLPASQFASGAATHDLRVDNPTPGGGASASLPFAVVGLGPILNGVTIPAGGIARAGYQQVIEVQGSNFQTQSIVRWNGFDLATTFLSSSLLSAIVPAQLIPSAGAFGVEVHTSGPAGGTSSTVVVNAVFGLPNISVLSPNSVLSGAGGAVTIQILGQGFTPQTIVLFDDIQMPVTYVSFDRIDVTISQWMLLTSRFLDVQAFNPAPGGGGGIIDGFLVRGPVITGLSPSVIAPMTPSSTPIVLTINVSDVGSGSIVRANGVALPTTLVNSSTLQAVIDGNHPATQAAGGINLHVVRNMGLGLVASNAVGLTVGSASTPDNKGTVTIAPAPPALSQPFTIRFEAPAPGSAVSAFIDLTQVGTFPLSGPGGWDVVVGVGSGQPIAIYDGLGILGPPTGHVLTDYTPASVPLLTGLGVIEVRDFFAPPVVVGLSFQFQAVYQDPASPVGLSLTHVLKATF
ncbi:MAG: IPT/TIG domain-containing protein [Planctomycetes bacterium]|nr:IPT/TIG domain-containing protein [Planctomycetota bacterium]